MAVVQCPLSGNLSLTLLCWVKPQECASCFDGFTIGRSAWKIRKSGALLSTVSSQAEIHHALLTLTLTCSQPVLCDSHVPRLGVEQFPHHGASSNWDAGLFLGQEDWMVSPSGFGPIFGGVLFFALPESETCDVFYHGPCIGRWLQCWTKQVGLLSHMIM